MSETLDYSYRPKGWKILLAIAVMLVIAGGLAHIASGNEAGLRFFRLFTISPGAATISYWGLAAACAALAIMGLVALAAGAATRTHCVRLTASDFTAPFGGLRREPVTVPLSEIEGVEIQNIHGVRLLVVKTARGKVAINRGDIGKAAFDELAEALARRLQEARG